MSVTLAMRTYVLHVTIVFATASDKARNLKFVPESHSQFNEASTELAETSNTFLLCEQCEERCGHEAARRTRRTKLTLALLGYKGYSPSEYILFRIGESSPPPIPTETFFCGVVPEIPDSFTFFPLPQLPECLLLRCCLLVSENKL